ncbi:redoxin domain-containing protein, partial [candidate division WOR-3 bacterium]|nr:redoxin domain-containing protein [candidate division WOR-3 bacterium]MBD3363711.1 redoxin domain-containing protein [candidate division WOR-3 bacterium]
DRVAIPEDSLEQESHGYILTTQEGAEVTNLDLLGKPVVLDLFGVACGPCRNALIFTQKMADEYGDQAHIYAVNAWNDTPEQISELWTELVIDLPVLICDQTFLDRFAIDAVPTYCVYNQEGELVEKLVGYSEDNEKALEKKISRLVRKNGEAEIAEVPPEEAIEERGDEPQVAAAMTEEEYEKVYGDVATPDTPAEDVPAEEIITEEETFIEGEVGVVEAATAPPVDGEAEAAGTQAAKTPEDQTPIKVEVIIHNYLAQPVTGASRTSPVVISSQQSGASAEPIVISAGTGTSGSSQTVPVVISSSGSHQVPYSYSAASQKPMGTVPVVISPGGSYGTGYTPGYGNYGTYGYTVQPPRGILYFHDDTSSIPYGSASGIYRGYSYTPQGYARQPQALLNFHTDETSKGYRTQTYTPNNYSYGRSTQSSDLTFHQGNTATNSTWYVVSFEPKSATLDYADMAVIRSAAEKIASSSGSYVQLVSYSTISSVADNRLQAVAGGLVSAGVSANRIQAFNTSGQPGSYTTLRSVEIFVQGGEDESEGTEPETGHGVKPPTTK